MNLPTKLLALFAALALSLQLAYAGALPAGSSVQYTLRSGDIITVTPGSGVSTLVQVKRDGSVVSIGSISTATAYGPYTRDTLVQMDEGSVDGAYSVTSPNTLATSTGGSVATAAALAATPTQCTGVQFATGIAANGNANCATAASAGTTASIGGGALTAGQCASGTATVAGAPTTGAVAVSPNTYPGDGFSWDAYVSATGTVTVKVCAEAAGTPTAGTYNVRVIP